MQKRMVAIARTLPLILALFLGPVQAAEYLTPNTSGCRVRLIWEPSPDTNVIGYNVYYGFTSRGYTKMQCAGTNCTITLSNLTLNTVYYFAATAFDSWGLESDFSDECVWTSPDKITEPGTMQVVRLAVLTSTNLQTWGKLIDLYPIDLAAIEPNRFFKIAIYR